MVRATQRLSNRVDFNLLELFDAVYRLRSLTAAGLELGLSQPAMSRCLARLRDAYGDQLFVRSSEGLLPTPAADALFECAGVVLEVVRRSLEASGFEPRTSNRTFHLAMSDTAEQVFLPRLAAHIARVAPSVDIESRQLSTPQLAKAMAMGSVDLALGYFNFENDGLYQQKLFDAQYACIARRDHPKIPAKLTLSQFKSLGHVVTGFDNTAHASAVDAFLRAPNVNARIAMKVGHFLSIGPIVAESDLIATIPRSLALNFERSHNVTTHSPPLRLPSYAVSQYWHARFNKEAGLLWLRSVIKELFS
ncbi:LysR family transcriptional regulator [Comamonas sp.]